MKSRQVFGIGTRTRFAMALALLAAACQAAGPQRADTFSAIAPAETVYLVGTEPFWSGEIAGGEAVWTTPEVMAGTRFRVDRFAGNNGLAFTGRMGAETFDVMVTAGRCSDGMSDRSYPYIATVKLGDRQLEGCAWTDRQAFTGPAAP